MVMPLPRDQCGIFTTSMDSYQEDEGDALAGGVDI